MNVWAQWFRKTLQRDVVVVVEPLPIDPERYQFAYKNATTALMLTMRHLDGVAWFDAELPPENHVCWPQTIGHDPPYRIARCPCGAISMRAAGERVYWMEKNSTRRYQESKT